MVLMRTVVSVVAIAGLSAPPRASALAVRTPQPVIVSANDSGPQLTSPDDGVYFDLDADGLGQRLAWTLMGSTDAFLAIDENHNGRIDNGNELVGGAQGPPNGFDYLRALDDYYSREELKQGRPGFGGLIDSKHPFIER
jgi:hypothetical protein